MLKCILHMHTVRKYLKCTSKTQNHCVTTDFRHIHTPKSCSPCQFLTFCNLCQTGWPSEHKRLGLFSAYWPLTPAPAVCMWWLARTHRSRRACERWRDPTISCAAARRWSPPSAATRSSGRSLTSTGARSPWWGGRFLRKCHGNALLFVKGNLSGAERGTGLPSYTLSVTEMTVICVSCS